MTYKVEYETIPVAKKITAPVEVMVMRTHLEGNGKRFEIVTLKNYVGLLLRVRAEVPRAKYC